MFPFDLDHFNLLILLVLAFFSYKAYHSNTLAIKAEDQKQIVETEKEQLDQEIYERSSELDELHRQNVQDLDLVREEQPIFEKKNVEVSEPNGQIYVELQTSEAGIIQIQAESGYIASSQTLQKQEDQDSTLMNRNLNGQFPKQQIDQEIEDSCSHSGSSDSRSSSDSSSLGEQDKQSSSSNKQKRKHIKKTKRRLKKNLGIQNNPIGNPVKAINIQ